MSKNYWWKEPTDEQKENKSKLPMYENKPPASVQYPLDRQIDWYDIYEFRRKRIDERYTDEKAKLGKDVWPNNYSINVINKNTYAADRAYWRAFDVPTGKNYLESEDDSPDQKYERHFFINNSDGEAKDLKSQLNAAIETIAELEAINADLQEEHNQLINDLENSHNYRNNDINYEEEEYFEGRQVTEYNDQLQEQNDSQWEEEYEYEEYISENQSDRTDDWTEIEDTDYPQICQIELLSPPAKRRKTSFSPLLPYDTEADTESASASESGSDNPLSPQTSRGARVVTANDTDDRISI